MDIGANGEVRMSMEKVDGVMSWKEPVNVKGVRKFLSFANFYRHFIKDFAKIAQPLHDLTKKDQPWSWGPAHQNAFDDLKQKFCEYPVLHIADPQKPLRIDTDASDFAIAGVLQQPDDAGLLHPVGYFSRKLTPAEINYEVHDKELLAVVESFRDMRAWLHGSTPPVSVISDHKNLEYFMTSRVLNRRQAR